MRINYCHSIILKVRGFVAVDALLTFAVPYAAEVQDADALVQQLSGLPAELYPGPMVVLCPPQPRPCPDPPLPPAEAKRQHVEDQLRGLKPAGVSALARGLGSSDVSVRRNSALMLLVLSDGLGGSDPVTTKIDIRAALSALIATLNDQDFRARGLAAQAVGEMREYAAPAVPALVKMLASEDEGLRNSACIGLTGIGPPARDALPALKKRFLIQARTCDISQHLRLRALKGVYRGEPVKSD